MREQTPGTQPDDTPSRPVVWPPSRWPAGAYAMTPYGPAGELPVFHFDPAQDVYRDLEARVAGRRGPIP